MAGTFAAAELSGSGDWLTIERAGVSFWHLRRVICAGSARSWMIVKTWSHMLFDRQYLRVPGRSRDVHKCWLI